MLCILEIMDQMMRLYRKTQFCSKSTEFLSRAARAQNYLMKVFSFYGSIDEKCILAQLFLWKRLPTL